MVYVHVVKYQSTKGDFTRILTASNKSNGVVMYDMGHSTRRDCRKFMKASLLSLSSFVGLVVASPCFAQQTQIINTVSDSRSPIEHVLQSELAMPGLGISASRNQIMNRFQYALDHKWLTAAQVQDFCNELKTITDREEKSRDENGKLSYEARASAAKQLNALNDRFEQTVLSKEQSRSNIDGLRARRAVLLQKVSKAESDGILNQKAVGSLNLEIAAAGASLKRKQLAEEELQSTSDDLAELDKRIDDEIAKAAALAAAPPAPSAFASIKPRLDALTPKLSVKTTMDAIKPKIDAIKPKLAVKPKLEAIKPRLDAMKPKLQAMKPNFSAMSPTRIKEKFQQYYSKATGTGAAAQATATKPIQAAGTTAPSGAQTASNPTSAHSN